MLGLGSVLHCAGSLGLRFCIGSFFKTSFNSTLLRISTLDSVNVLDSESALDSPNSALFRFCLCSLLRISLDSVIVSESKWLDSVNVLDSVFPRFSALDSESALDSVDSKFLRVVFSRILSNFLESCVFSQKGVSPLPALPSPEKDKAPLFLLRFACKPSARQTGRVPRFFLV